MKNRSILKMVLYSAFLALPSISLASEAAIERALKAAQEKLRQQQQTQQPQQQTPQQQTPQPQQQTPQQQEQLRQQQAQQQEQLRQQQEQVRQQQEQLRQQQEQMQQQQAELQRQLTEEREARQRAETAARNFQTQIAALQQQIAQLNRNVPLQQQQAPVANTVQQFVDNYANRTPQEREQNFDVAFQDMVQRQDQASTIAVLRFILQRMQEIAIAAGNNPTQDQTDEFNALQDMQGRIGTSPSLAAGREQHQREIEAQALQQERTDDQQSYNNVRANLDVQLNTGLVNLANSNLLPNNQAHRNIPVLLYLLKIRHDVLVGNRAFEQIQWAQMSPFIKNLTLEQRRALRSYMKQGDFPNTITAGEAIKDAILSFLDTLTEKINNNEATRVMTMGDVRTFNTNLARKTKDLLVNSPF